MVIVVCVCSPNQFSRDGVTEEDGEDVVLDGVSLVFVKGDQDEGVLHEVLVGKKWLQEVSQPFACYGDGGIVTIRCHVWGDEHPLGKGVSLEIFKEHGCVFDEGSSLRVCDDAVVHDLRAEACQFCFRFWRFFLDLLVFSDVVVGAILLIDIGHSFESGIRHVFLVKTPSDSLVL